MAQSDRFSAASRPWRRGSKARVRSCGCLQEAGTRADARTGSGWVVDESEGAPPLRSRRRPSGAAVRAGRAAALGVRAPRVRAAGRTGIGRPAAALGRGVRVLRVATIARRPCRGEMPVADGRGRDRRRGFCAPTRASFEGVWLKYVRSPPAPVLTRAAGPRQRDDRRAMVMGLVRRLRRSRIPVVQAADPWKCDDPPRTRRFHGPPAGRVAVERHVRAILVVVGDVVANQTQQMPRTEHEHVVEQLASQRAHEPFGEAVLPRRPGRDTELSNAEMLDSRVEPEPSPRKSVHNP